MKFKYICNDCGAEYESDTIHYTCPKCAKKNKEGVFSYGNLNVELDPEELKKLGTKRNLKPMDFLPFALKSPDAYKVGSTPFIKPTRIAKSLGLKNLHFKLDSQLISGSFKDRASIAVVAQAQHFKEKKIALASTGNAGAAMSAIGAAYNLDIILFVPEKAPINKLMQSILYNAKVVPVQGTYDDAFALSLYYTEKFGGINRNTAYNPITIEGKKTVSIEMFLDNNKKPIDVVYVPVGDGCIISGVAKGFADLVKAGLIEKSPKIIAVQSTKSNAIFNAIENDDFSSLEKADTIADSISVCSPAAGRQATRYVKESGGYAIEVEDEDILKAQRELCSKAGVFVEPAAATAYAGLLKDLDNLKSSMGADANVVCLFTGTGFKDMSVFNGKVSMPKSIENSKEAVEKLFKK